MVCGHGSNMINSHLVSATAAFKSPLTFSLRSSPPFFLYFLVHSFFVLFLLVSLSSMSCSAPSNAYLLFRHPLLPVFLVEGVQGMFPCEVVGGGIDPQNRSSIFVEGSTPKIDLPIQIPIFAQTFESALTGIMGANAGIHGSLSITGERYPTVFFVNDEFGIIYYYNDYYNIALHGYINN